MVIGILLQRSSIQCPHYNCPPFRPWLGGISYPSSFLDFRSQASLDHLDMRLVPDLPYADVFDDPILPYKERFSTYKEDIGNRYRLAATNKG
jgi:hypothetical protein